MGLGISRNEGETWKEAALRYAEPYGLAAEVEEEYEANVAVGAPEDRAALWACLEWDVAEVVER